MLVVATASGAFHNGPGLGHRTPNALHQPLSLVHMSRMHSGPRGLCAQWGGASESLSHTSGAWPYPQYVLGRRFWARNVTIA